MLKANCEIVVNKFKRYEHTSSINGWMKCLCGISFIHKNLHGKLTWTIRCNWNAPSCILIVVYAYHIHVYCNLCNYYNFSNKTHSCINTLSCKCPLQLKNPITSLIVKPLIFSWCIVTSWFYKEGHYTSQIKWTCKSPYLHCLKIYYLNLLFNIEVYCLSWF